MQRKKKQPNKSDFKDRNTLSSNACPEEACYHASGILCTTKNLYFHNIPNFVIVLKNVLKYGLHGDSS